MTQRELLLDTESGLSQACGDINFYREILQMFVEETPIQLSALKSALLRSEQAESFRIAHTVKSTAAIIGALELSTFAAQLELFASQGALLEMQKELLQFERSFVELKTQIMRLGLGPE